jgi:hypothetical protein
LQAEFPPVCRSIARGTVTDQRAGRHFPSYVQKS